jgi:hypothetical protein
MLFPALLVALVQVPLPPDTNVRGIPAPRTYCLPQSQAALGGIPLDAPKEVVLKHLGKPQRQRSTTGEDDGGAYTVTQLLYPRLQVDLGRGEHVELLLTSRPGVTTPAGIQVGQTLEEVARRLGIPDTLSELTGAHWSPRLCDDGPLDTYAVEPGVTFFWEPVPGPLDPAGRLSQAIRLARIQMDYYGP